MNPILQAVMSTVIRLKRTCPQCKRDQVVPRSKRLERVPGTFCGADIPPRKQVMPGQEGHRQINNAQPGTNDAERFVP